MSALSALPATAVVQSKLHLSNPRYSTVCGSSCLLEFYTTLWFPKKYSSKKLSGIWIFHMHCIILRALFHVTHSFLNSTSWMAIIASLFFCESSSYRSYRACTTRRPNFLFQREKFIQKLESNPNQRHSKLKAILINIIEHIFGL